MANLITSVTNTFVANTKALSAAVNQNFTDLVNALSDGTTDLDIGTLFLSHGVTTASHSIGSSDTFRFLDSNFATTTGAEFFLPTASANDGRVLTLKNLGTTAGTLTITPISGELIDSLTSLLLQKRDDSVTIRSDNTNWQIVSYSAQANETTTGLVSSYAPVVKSSLYNTSAVGYTILTNDGYKTIVTSPTASLTGITLPTAASNAGRSIKIINTDGTFKSTIFGAAAGETVGGISGTTGFDLVEKNDFVEVECDGSVWHVTNYRETSLFTAFTVDLSNFTDGSSTGFYRRNGEMLEVRFRVNSGATGAATNVSFNTNTNVGRTIDSTKITSNMNCGFAEALSTNSTTVFHLLSPKFASGNDIIFGKDDGDNIDGVEFQTSGSDFFTGHLLIPVNEYNNSVPQ